MMRIRYNAPVTLTFALLATTVLLFDTVTRSNLTLLLFTALPRGNFDFANPLAYVPADKSHSRSPGMGASSKQLCHNPPDRPDPGRKTRIPASFMDDIFYCPGNRTGEYPLFPYRPSGCLQYCLHDDHPGFLYKCKKRRYSPDLYTGGNPLSCKRDYPHHRRR